MSDARSRPSDPAITTSSIDRPPMIAVLSAGAWSLATVAGRPLLAHALTHAVRSASSFGPGASGVRLVSVDPEEARLARDLGVDVVAHLGDVAGDDAAPIIAMHAAYPALDLDAPQRALELLAGADVVLAGVPMEDRAWRRPAPEGPWERVADPSPWLRQVYGLSAGRGRAWAASPFSPPKGARVAMLEVGPDSGLVVSRESGALRAGMALRDRAEREATAALARIRALVCDFDGVMTDNRVIVAEDGRESVLASRGDGLGVSMLRKAGFPIMVLSMEKNPVVARRCEKLAIRFVQGEDDKLPTFRRMLAEIGLTPGDAAYMGNDVNDLAAMRASGVSIAPSDSHPRVLREARLITRLPGGHGAVREAIDWIIAARGLPTPYDA